MNEDITKGSWEQFKGKIKSKWGKLTGNDLTEIKGNTEQVSGKIQKNYGIAKDKVDSKYQDLKKSF